MRKGEGKGGKKRKEEEEEGRERVRKEKKRKEKKRKEKKRKEKKRKEKKRKEKKKEFLDQFTHTRTTLNKDIKATWELFQIGNTITNNQWNHQPRFLKQIR